MAEHVGTIKSQLDKIKNVNLVRSETSREDLLKMVDTASQTLTNQEHMLKLRDDAIELQEGDDGILFE